MRAEHDDFVRFLAAGQVSDSVVDLNGTVAELVGHFDFDFHGAVLQHAKDHAIAFASDERGGNRADVEFLAADAGHIQEPVGLAGIAEDGGYAFALVELVAHASQFDEAGERRGCCRLALCRRRRLHGANELVVGIFGFWR